MEASLEYLWRVVLWGFGSCLTGFFVLLGIVLKISASVTKPVQEIRDALVGTYKKKGLITKFHEIEEDVEEIKKNISFNKSEYKI